jgi:hypothetical protein
LQERIYSIALAHSARIEKQRQVGEARTAAGKWGQVCICVVTFYCVSRGGGGLVSTGIGGDGLFSRIPTNVVASAQPASYLPSSAYTPLNPVALRR